METHPDPSFCELCGRSKRADIHRRPHRCTKPRRRTPLPDLADKKAEHGYTYSSKLATGFQMMRGVEADDADEDREVDD